MPPSTSDEPAPRLGRRWKAILSVLIALHLTAVIIPPLAAPPGSPLAFSLFGVVAPYVEACYLNHGYKFFAPEPGPGHLVRYELEMADGSRRKGVFPNRHEHWPRLLYHRYFMLSDQLILPPTPPEELPPEVKSQLQWSRDYMRSYAQHLAAEHDAKQVTLYYRTHEIPPPIEVARGAKLDDPRSYHEDVVLRYPEENP